MLNRYQEFPNAAHDEVVDALVLHLLPLIGLEKRPVNDIEFLKTLLRDYIVLTR
ncbi:MAG: hypothetical protein IPJ82_19200 [Lewinellaceae bacterium]|nr:hypothetical protein [Lewinellaceae bacterium]